MKFTNGRDKAESILENDWYKTANRDEMERALLVLMADVCDDIASGQTDAINQLKNDIRIARL